MTDYVKLGEEFDGGTLVYLNARGGVVVRNDEYFVYPIGQTLDRSLSVDGASDHPRLQAGALRHQQALQAAEEAHRLAEEQAQAEKAAQEKAAKEAKESTGASATGEAGTKGELVGPMQPASAEPTLKASDPAEAEPKPPAKQKPEAGKKGAPGQKPQADADTNTKNPQRPAKSGDRPKGRRPKGNKGQK
jgi:hypothetical protein